MKRRKVNSRLDAALASGELVELERRARKWEPTTVDGRIIGLSEYLVAVAWLNGGDPAWDGIVLLPRGRITRCRPLVKLVPFFGLVPPPPQPPHLPENLALDSLQDAFDALRGNGTVVIVKEEYADGEPWSFGVIAKAGRRSVTLLQVNNRARFAGTARVAYSDISQVAFGGSYTTALQAAAIVTGTLPDHPAPAANA